MISQCRDAVMFYQSGVAYPEMGITKSDGDVLDLCVRKQEKDDGDKFQEDVNGNGLYGNYAGRGDYRCGIPQETRYIQPAGTPDSSIMQDKIFDERMQQPSSNSSQQTFAADSPLTARFLPLTTPITTIRNGKPTRPFKAYPKDFLALATSEGLLDDSNKRYMEFRRQFLTQLHATAGLNSNKNMKRPVQSDSPSQLPSSSGDAKDQAYWERRKKNNEAAKKSRDARRAKEDEIAIRAAFLERENVRLKLELASLRSETDRLRCMLYSS